MLASAWNLKAANTARVLSATTPPSHGERLTNGGPVADGRALTCSYRSYRL